MTTAAAGLAVIMLGACQDAPMPTQPAADAVLTPDAAPLMQMHQQDGPRLVGRTIQNLDLAGVIEETGEAAQFTGRIVNLDFALDETGELILASGRLVGQLTTNGVTERINQAFDGLDITGLLTADNDGVTQILFLELGPVFLDLLGLVVEIPDPIILEIRAERGPGQLLGNLLVGLLGLLD